MNLLSINTSLPEHAFSTTELIEAFDGRLSRDLIKTIQNLEVEKRHTVVRNFPEAMTRKDTIFDYTSSATDLACKAAIGCIEEANITAADVGLIIAVTNTQNYIIPGLAYSMIAHRRDIFTPTMNLVNMQGQGCSALVKAIEVADWYLQIHADKKVLVVASEAHSPYSQKLLETQYCSFQEINKSDWDQTKKTQKTRSTTEIVQSFLFGDGAVALLFCTGNAINFKPICHLTNMESKDAGILMFKEGGSYNPEVFGKVAYEMDKSVPRRGLRYVKEMLENILTHSDSPISSAKQSDFLLIHTGSKKILDKIVTDMDISTDSQKVSSPYKVLRSYGNLSSASVGFMLAEIQHEGVGIILSFGVGFSASATIVSFNGAGIRGVQP